MSNFGEITGYPEGSAFTSREEARQAGLHRHKIAGISGTGTDGADAIVLNDGYEDDKDGSPYLEPHHIVWLSRGGEDTPSNTVALCPNCHRRMHIVKSATDTKKLTDKVSH